MSENTRYLTADELIRLHLNTVSVLPNRIPLRDKIGIAAMVIDEANAVIDRISDEKADQDA